MIDFTHLHVHSHYSILDGMSSIDDLVNKVKNSKMRAIALTDHGTMYGIKEFFNKVNKVNKEIDDPASKIKAILGVETYVAQRSYKINNKSNERKKEDIGGWHLILLAKNLIGYKNLCKLMSEAYINGFYNRPRIDKELLEKYHEGIIVSSACLGGEIPQKLLGSAAKDVDADDNVDMGNEDNIKISNENFSRAEDAVKWFKSIFKDDFYLEIQRHKTNEEGGNTNVYKLQTIVNTAILELAKKTNTKVIATNDVHFVEESHADAHDRLICLSTGKDLNDPKRMRYTKQEWLKTPEEMLAIFSDIPEVLQNTMEIVDKVEIFDINNSYIMPEFEIPKDFATIDEYRTKYSEEDLKKEFVTDEGEERYSKLADGEYEKILRIKLEADYLTKLTLEGAKERYGYPFSDNVEKRLNEELKIVKCMGYPGYFLIVQDLINEARKIGVLVGPGRGSAAGSVIAYCLKITNIDPFPYGLLFERFLNPDRISMPDIDIDFDDVGRGKILNWVTDKYGKERVAHIVTYGTMAAKSSIKDIARVHKLPLPESDRLSKLVPNKFEVLDKNGEIIKDEKGKPLKLNLKNCYKYLPEFKAELKSDNPLIVSTLKYAEMLEGTVRQVGVHACGIIIGAEDLSNTVPLSTSKDKETGEDIIVTQYEGTIMEDIGLIKMDFLGLKNLSIIDAALKNIKKHCNLDIDIEKIPIDDTKTYELFGEGNTIGTFQFESDGMRKYLRDLKPSKFEDLIAMNALYRPGPMDKIPDYIERKYGRQKIDYPFPEMEEYLKDTYGITVYQEQVMLLSRLLAGFTRGKSDELRKIMGKKDASKFPPLREAFIKGATDKGYNKKILEKIWEDWEKFGSYAFNKSHATCYSLIAYQTAYLKANYPSEYVAALLTNNLDDIKEVTKLMDEAKRMGITVLGPHINESDFEFSVRENGAIRFGMAGIKNVGTKAVEAIIAERETNGKYKDIFDLVARVDAKSVNKKAIESLAYSGAFDSFENLKRYQYFSERQRKNDFSSNNDNNKETQQTFLDDVIVYGNVMKLNTAPSLFGEDENTKPQTPIPYYCEPISEDELLNKEKEVIGLYLSGHPLDIAKFYFNALKPNTTLSQMQEKQKEAVKNISIIVYVSITTVKYTKTGIPMLVVSVFDYEDSYEFTLFGRDYDDYSHYFIPKSILFINASFNEGKNKNKGRVFFNINSVMSLSAANFSQLNLYCELSKINDNFLKDFKEINESQINFQNAKTKIKIRVLDIINNDEIDIISHYNFVLNEKFIKFVTKYFPEGQYSIDV